MASAMTSRIGDSKSRVGADRTISRARLIRRPDADREGISEETAENSAPHSAEACRMRPTEAGLDGRGFGFPGHSGTGEMEGELGCHNSGVAIRDPQTLKNKRGKPSFSMLTGHY